MMEGVKLCTSSRRENFFMAGELLDNALQCVMNNDMHDDGYFF